MRKYLYNSLQLFFYLSFIQAQDSEILDYAINEETNKTYQYFSCPMLTNFCGLKMNIENDEEIKDFNVTEISGIKYFNFIKL